LGADEHAKPRAARFSAGALHIDHDGTMQQRQRQQADCRLSARTRMRTSGQRRRMWATMRATSSTEPAAASIFARRSLAANRWAPVIAALIIVAGSQFPWVAGIDKAARSFCLYVAAIPREADRLAIELAQSTKFQPEKLRRKVNNIISENIGLQAFNFSSDGTLPARFTRAVALYWLFVGPRNNNNFDFSVNTHSRAAYARILQLADDVLTRADFRYEDLMQRGLAYFTSQRPSKD
jgi:hypothetical protein